ncbi:MAG: hypothetical protein CMJ23_13290 [Phycisphaerae bacterium]|nr:hypothetical protein [Phycisphaerae bacterium]
MSRSNDSGYVSATLCTSSTPRIDGGATAFHLDGDRFGVMHELVELSILDGALEARTGEAVPTGVQVSLGFETPGMTARRGEVVRCAPYGEGWKIGIRLAEAA